MKQMFAIRLENDDDEEEGITVRDDMFSRLIQPPIANTALSNRRENERKEDGARV